MRQLGVSVVIFWARRRTWFFLISSNGAGTRAGRPGLAVGMESSCPGPGGSVMGHKKLPPDLACAGCPESSWTRARRGRGLEPGRGWHVTVMSGKPGGGGGGDAILHQGRVHQGWQKGMRLGRACPRHWFSFRGLQSCLDLGYPRSGASLG